MVVPVLLVILMLVILFFLNYLQKEVDKQREREAFKAKKRIEKQKELEYQAHIEREKLKNLEQQKRLAEEEKLRQLEQERLMNELAEAQKYMFFDTSTLNYNLSDLYRKVIKINRWNNEPFHAKFYEFLMLMNDNEFMVIDSQIEPLTLLVRDENNILQVSKAYQVFSSQGIIVYVINHIINNFDESYSSQDIQDTMIAIFIIALMQSVHYLATDILLQTIEKLMNDYPRKNNISEIISLIKVKNSRYTFIINAFEKAFLNTQTLPYNDSIVPKTLTLPAKLPKKYLQTI